MNSPMLMTAFSLAAHLGEYDPRKIANLPADILLHWQAWLSLTSNPIQTPAQEPPASPAVSVTDQQCADVMRILGQ